MTITRTQLQQLRDTAKADAKGHSVAIDAGLTKLSAELEHMDAAMAKESLLSVSADGVQDPPKKR